MHEGATNPPTPILEPSLVLAVPMLSDAERCASHVHRKDTFVLHRSDRARKVGRESTFGLVECHTLKVGTFAALPIFVLPPKSSAGALECWCVDVMHDGTPIAPYVSADLFGVRLPERCSEAQGL
jgi:hypothetical protein